MSPGYSIDEIAFHSAYLMIDSSLTFLLGQGVLFTCQLGVDPT
jgi:hypothetical protein